MARRPAATGAARRRTSSVIVTKPTADRSARKLKVLIADDDVQDRLEELRIIQQRERVIMDELRTYVRETGKAAEGCGYWFDWRRSIRDQVPRMDLSAQAWLETEMLETGIAKTDAKGIFNTAVFLLGKACERIDIRSWPKFLYETGHKPAILKRIAELDKDGDEGLFRYEGEPRLDLRKSDADDETSEKCAPPVPKKRGG